MLQVCLCCCVEATHSPEIAGLPTRHSAEKPYLGQHYVQDDDDESAKEAARVAHIAEFLLHSLQLSKEEARQIAMVARALTRQGPPQGSASTASTGQS